MMTAEAIERIIEEELNRGSQLNNLHGIARENVKQFLTTPYKRYSVDPMKKLFLSALIFAIYSVSFSQRVVSYRLLNDIDYDYNIVDSQMSKNNLSVVRVFRCNGNGNGNDSCILISLQKYDRDGRLIELTSGNDLAQNEVDYVINYKRLSDFLFETTVRFSCDSKIIPDDFYIDTIINNTPKKREICAALMEMSREEFLQCYSRRLEYYNK